MILDNFEKVSPEEFVKTWNEKVNNGILRCDEKIILGKNPNWKIVDRWRKFLVEFWGENYEQNNKIIFESINNHKIKNWQQFIQPYTKEQNER